MNSTQSEILIMTGDDLFLLASTVWGGVLVAFALISLIVARVRAPTPGQKGRNVTRRPTEVTAP